MGHVAMAIGALRPSNLQVELVGYAHAQLVVLEPLLFILDDIGVAAAAVRIDTLWIGRVSVLVAIENGQDPRLGMAVDAAYAVETRMDL